MAKVPSIHPTAIISAEAELADDVQVGPYVVIEGKVRVASGCVLRPYVHLVGPLTMGCGNTVFSGAVLGERPQHLRYADEPTSVQIGDNNIFREHVTVHRGTTHSWVTRVGNQNLFMAHSHVAHDCQIGNRCLIANGAQIAGHCVLADQVYLSGNCGVHQFVTIGRLALLSGGAMTTKDVPPFVMQQGFDTVVGLNLVGMRRAGMSAEQINSVRRAFRILFREGMATPSAAERLEHDLGHIDAVAEIIAFLRQSSRGINLMRDRNRDAA